MTALSPDEIRVIAQRLARRCPELRNEIERLAHQAAGGKTLSYVEVTHSNGTVEVMPAHEYQRRTSTSFGIISMRVLSDKEAQRLGG